MLRTALILISLVTAAGIGFFVGLFAAGIARDGFGTSPEKSVNVGQAVGLFVAILWAMLTLRKVV